jgi:hypothetical protein
VKLDRLLLVTFVAALFPASAPLHAETYLSPFVGAAFGGRTEDSKLTYGGSLTIAGRSSVVGVAIDFSRTPDFLGTTRFGDNSVTSLMANLVLVSPGSVRLYGSAGVGLLETRVKDITGFFDVDSNDFGFNAGGGILAFPGGPVGLLGDVRYFRNLTNPTPNGNFDIDLGGLSFWRAVGGISFRF